MPGDRNSIKKTRNADAIPRATDEECGSLHVMADEDAPLDVEAFHPHIVENNSEDDDFVSVRKKRKHCQPKNCQPATQRNKKCIRVKNATKKSEKAKHGLEQIILTTTIQTTEPTVPDPDAQQLDVQMECTQRSNTTMKRSNTSRISSKYNLHTLNSDADV